jgi:outer membrane protein assembly factor BamB
MGASYAGGNIYVSTWQGTLRAVDPDNGNILWTQTPGGNLYSHIPTDDTRIFVGYYGGGYKAFDFNGNLQWTKTVSGNPDSGAPIVYQDRLITPSPANQIQARNKTNGNVAWTWFRPNGVGWLQNGTPAAANGRVFGSAFTDYLTLQHQGFIVALDHNNGAELWRYSTYGGGGGYTAPVVTGDKVMFGGAASAFVTAVSPTNGSVIWRVNINSGMDESVPALYGNQLFVFARNGYLHAIE